MVVGISPYERFTYRYSPVVAASLIPNVLSQPFFGKLCFVVGDFMTGWLVLEILSSCGSSQRTKVASVICWLFNPFTLAMSTRGSFESAVSTAMLSTLLLLLSGNTFLACAVLGLVIHLRIYPVIYLIPMCRFLCLDCDVPDAHSWDRRIERSKDRRANYFTVAIKSSCRIFSAIASITFTRRLELLALCMSSISIWLLCFLFFGSEFQSETYSYHLGRKDVRHNFSPIFYVEYIAPRVPLRAMYTFTPVLPQMVTVCLVGFKFANDLPACLLLQTIGFVSLNKVSTAQYFVWYMSLIPTALPSGIVQCSGCKSSASLAGQDLYRAASLLFWLSAQFLWLIVAYHVEFCGTCAFLLLWFASVVFLCAHAWVGTHLMTARTKFMQRQ